ncbi:MAG: Bax inhibitor-1/YccA family protein [Candidatus Peregrinibacteria bacterium]
MMEEATYSSSPSDALAGNRYLTAVYGWMTGALLVSAVVAWFAGTSGAFVQAMSQKPGLFFGLVILQLVAVVALAGWVQRMNVVVAMLVFLGYSALTGLTLSTIFLVYTVASIAQTFVVAAGMFGAMSLYGYVTKRDLSGWGSFLFMSLIGLIIASLVNLFVQTHFLTWVTTYAGIIIFAGLAAYDTWRLKMMGAYGAQGHQMAIHGALSLYLDFINLFLHLLRVMGNRR